MVYCVLCCEFLTFLFFNSEILAISSNCKSSAFKLVILRERERLRDREGKFFYFYSLSFMSHLWVSSPIGQLKGLHWRMFIVTVSRWTAATLHWGTMKGRHSCTGNVHVKYLAVKGKNFWNHDKFQSQILCWIL